MILLIDNYDSFTWNLAQYLGELGAPPVVKRNDEITLDEIAAPAARADRHFAGTRPAGGGRHLGRRDPPVRLRARRCSASASATRRSAIAFGGEVVRAPRVDARQGLVGGARRQGRVQGDRPAVHRRPLSLADRRRSAARRPRGRRAHRRRHADGAAAPDAADPRRAVPSRVGADRRGAPTCCAISWSSDVRPTARETASPRGPDRPTRRRPRWPRSWTAAPSRRRSPACWSRCG